MSLLSHLLALLSLFYLSQYSIINQLFFLSERLSFTTKLFALVTFLLILSFAAQHGHSDPLNLFLPCSCLPRSSLWQFY